jgi:SPX domain protein involved in polyphosphate accumulation
MSIIYTTIISLIVIFITHRGFYYVKHYLTEEETEHIGVFQSKKYDELIDELNNIKNKGISLDDTNNIDMEDNLTDFMNTVKDTDTDTENNMTEFMNTVC